MMCFSVEAFERHKIVCDLFLEDERGHGLVPDNLPDSF